VLPLASEDRTGNVVYVGTLSKVLAPGLRVGYVAAPRPVLERVMGLRTIVDRQGDLAMEAALAELLDDGELRRHARRTRREYAARRDALVDGLRRELSGILSFEVPPGGMALWVGTGELDADAWAEASRERGVGFFPGRVYAFDGRALPFVRLGYARLTVAELGDAVRRAAAAAQELTRRPRPPRRAAAARPATRSAHGRGPGGRGTDPSRH
jgi:GntR family transcriptional regulator/MocR family aminotransferase